MKIRTSIVLALSIVAVTAVICYMHEQPATQVPAQGKLITGTEKETFSGTITAVDTGCFYDATCSVSVDGKKVILVTGGRAMSSTTPVGRLIGADSVGDLQQRIGDHANVYATTTPEGDYSIYGNSNYYVEVVKLK